MKQLKKAAAVVLALALSLALAGVAFADNESNGNTYSIKINNSAKGHTYEAYQIFAGDVSVSEGAGEDDEVEYVLSNIVWGSGVSEEGQEALLNKYEVTSASELAGKLTEGNAVEFAGVAGAYLAEVAGSDSVEADAKSHDGKYVISNLRPGYYLVKDKDATLADAADAYTSYIVRVAGDIETTPKSGVPTVEKKVKDVNDSTGEATGWQDSADYDIGDTVSFQLTAELASNVSAYDAYRIVFHDTLAKGLTYDKNAKVMMGDKEVTGLFTITAEPNKDGATILTISCDDVKQKGVGATDESVITVEYTATLNANAEIGSAGNLNEVYLEFSNDPNAAPGNGTATGSVGFTPEDKVKVFTYQLVVNKVDGDGNALTGAGFTLYKKNSSGDYEAVGAELEAEGSTFTWAGLDDGDYKLVETTTPPGYNTADDVLFTISADHSVDATTPILTSLSASSDSEVSITPVADTGTVTVKVVNTAGLALPSTGGAGATAFYVVGGLLIAIGCALGARRLFARRDA